MWIVLTQYSRTQMGGSKLNNTAPGDATLHVGERRYVVDTLTWDFWHQFRFLQRGRCVWDDVTHSYVFYFYTNPALLWDSIPLASPDKQVCWLMANDGGHRYHMHTRNLLDHNHLDTFNNITWLDSNYRPVTYRYREFCRCRPNMLNVPDY